MPYLFVLLLLLWGCGEDQQSSDVDNGEAEADTVGLNESAIDADNPAEDALNDDADSTATPIEFEVISQESCISPAIFPYKTKNFLVITDEETFLSVYKNLAAMEGKPAPTIDFSQETVLALSIGELTSCGNKLVRVQSIELLEANSHFYRPALVKVVTTYQAGTAYPMVTYPYTMVRVKHVGEFFFSESLEYIGTK